MMKVNSKFLNRLKEVINTAESIIQSSTTKQKTISKGGYSWTRQTSSPPITQSYQAINMDTAKQWQINTLNILEKICGSSSNQFIEFKKISEKLIYENVKIAIAILKAVENDYENGYLFDTQILVEAEVFDDFLEQAEEFFKKGYYQTAAVIAGCVLEDSLRKFGQRKIPNFPTDKTIDPMNVELAKAGIYNALWQKKITALADLRNKAAHGKWTEFSEKDVEDMIRDVRRFMEDYFS